jgi:hypothetical protein
VADEQINIKPLFEQTKVPCDGEAGDLLVLTPLKEGEPDTSPQGQATLWFCIKSGKGERPATWVPVVLDGIATCQVVLPPPPQNRPPVRREG